MKSFTDLFIHRPVLATVLNLLIIIAGVQAIRTLNVRQYPKSDSSVITISTAYVGADAELVRGFVTVPLERAIAGADGIEYMESTSSQGLSTISVTLNLNYDPTKALAEVSSKVDQVRGDLPPSAEVPIINIQSADDRFAIAYIYFTSEVLNQNEITDYLIRTVQPRLSALEGVREAEVLGDREFAARIWLDPARMAALNISPSQIRQSLGANNFLSAPGSTKGSYLSVKLKVDTDLRSIDEFQQLVVKQDKNTLVRLGDVAKVSLGAINYTSEVRLNGQTCIFIGIRALPTSNSLDVLKLVRKEMEQIEKDVPVGMDAGIGFDATLFIEESINEVIKTLIETLLIVILVIFLFLGSFRAVLIPIVAIPLSLIGAVFLMQLFGFSINLLTLLAIVLSVGLVVDDAIVVVENVERNLGLGKSPIEAAIVGVRELVGPIVAITVTLAAVYAPIGFQGGLTGSLFREFAFTLVGAVTVSGVVALTLSPVMSAHLLKPGMEEHGLPGLLHRIFEKLKNGYMRILDSTLRARPIVYGVWLILTLACIPMYLQSAKEVAPTEDRGIIFGIVNTPSNSTLDLHRDNIIAVNEIYQSFPETALTFQITRDTGGFSGMRFKPYDERDRSVFEVLPEVRNKLSQLPGIQIFPVVPGSLPGAGTFPVQFVIASTVETDQIVDFAAQIQLKSIESGMFNSPPQIDVKFDQPQAEISINRDKVAAMGLNLQQIGSDLSSMIGGNYVNRFNIEGRSYKVIPQIERAGRLTPEDLNSIYVTGPDDSLISLSSIATFTHSTSPRSLNRFQQLNAVKLTGSINRPLGEVLAFMEEEAKRLLPDGYLIDYTGESRQLQTEGNRFLASFALAIILIILVLAAQFNSFRDPFIIILGSVPLAMFGALIFTYLKMPNSSTPFFTNEWTTTLNIYSQVGLVTLIGLVSKNGILIVEFANKMQEQGRSKLEAVREASATRLRPILMTSMATVCGHFPLTLVSGAGAEARNSIGLVLVGGMAIGTVFTLFIVPSIYMLIAKEKSADRSEIDSVESERAANSI